MTRAVRSKHLIEKHRAPYVLNGVGYIPLTQGYTSMVDPEMLCSLTEGVSWRVHKGHTGKFYAVGSIGGRRCFLHNVLMAGKTPDGHVVDHVNGDGLDNRSPNLRVCTQKQNVANARPRRQNRSGYKGVCYHKRDRVWRAQLWVGGRRLNLGSFGSAADAARSYDRAALAAWGHFAWLNFPDGQR